MRSGRGDLDCWITERRNVYEDYQGVLGEEPENPRAVAISSETNDMHSVAEAFIGHIAFTP